MRERGRTFPDDLLATASPSGFETRSQRVWAEYVRGVADDVSVDAYGNAVAVHEGAPGAPAIAVTGHADDPVQRVIGQTAIHPRDSGDEKYEEIAGQFVDIGAHDAEAARDHIEVGDPVTFSADVEELVGDRIAAPGIDNRTGAWAAAEGLRLAVERDVDATVYAVSTVQEEVGLQGARMVGVDLDDVDAFVAVDVTHATDSPDVDRERRGRWSWTRAP